MTWYALRIATLFISIHSLLFFPTPIARAQKRPTEAEAKQAREIADLFVKRLEETGDFSQVIDEMYAGDFIERYLGHRIRDGEESNSASDITFAPGLVYKREVLMRTTAYDWRLFYIATHNFFYRLVVITLNKTANDVLNDREPADEIFDNIIPPSVITLFNNHPILKDVIEKDEKPKSVEPAQEPQNGNAGNDGEPESINPAEKPQIEGAGKSSQPKSIETREEMLSVVETLQEGLRLLIEAHGDHSLKLTDEAKKAIEMISERERERMEPSMDISDEECLGDPPGARHLDVLTPLMFNLMLTEVDGKRRILWATLSAGD